MRINSKNLVEVVNNYKTKIVNHRIVDIELVNSRLFLISLDKTDDKLIIDLDNTNPHIGLLKVKFDSLSLPSNFIHKLKSKGQPRIIDISILNEDRIINIKTSATDAFYHKLTFNLYIELISSRANMILTDENDKIISAFYETNINSPRLIIPNNKYVLPEKKELLLDNNIFDINKYDEYVLSSYKKSLEKRKFEIYHNQIKELKKKEKNIEKKLSFANINLENAKHYEEYKDKGNEILINKDSINIGDDSFNDIKLDKTKPAIENANLYFNKYKKLKRSIEIISNLINDLKQELDYIKYKLSIIEIGDESDINNFINNRSKKKIDAPSYFPYIIKYKNFNIYYGVNKYENDYLTFKMFNQNSDVIWFHLNNISSPHMIVNINTLEDNELELFSSLYLLICKKNCGEIMIANRKDITRSNKIGEVNVKNYKIIKINKINENSKSLFQHVKKYKSN